MRNIPFIPKRSAGPEPWIEFGGDSDLYDQWVGEVCAMACTRSLLLSRYGAAPSLMELTRKAVDYGVYVNRAGRILGAYHNPLAEMLASYGFSASIFGNASESQIRSQTQFHVSMLSINLEAVKPHLRGGHLVLVIDYDHDSDHYIVHDNAKLLCESGEACRLSSRQLSCLSNGKGIRVFVNW